MAIKSGGHHRSTSAAIDFALLAAAEKRTSEPVLASEVLLRAVFPSVGKIICMGLSYRAYIEESIRDLPIYPIWGLPEPANPVPE